MLLLMLFLTEMVFSTWLTIKMSLLVIIILLAHRHMQFYFCFIFYEKLNY